MSKKQITPKPGFKKSVDSLNDTLNTVNGILLSVGEAAKSINGILKTGKTIVGSFKSERNNTSKPRNVVSKDGKTSTTPKDIEMNTDNIDIHEDIIEENDVQTADVTAETVDSENDITDETINHENDTNSPDSEEIIFEGEPVEEDEIELDEITNFAHKVGNGISTALEATDALKVLEICADKYVKYITDTTKFIAEQETKQVKIRAKRDVAIAKIDKVTNLLKDYLDKTFDERKTIFNKQFEVVDEALRRGDNKMLQNGLTSINQLAAQSPFRDLSDFDEFQKALMDDDYVFDI